MRCRAGVPQGRQTEDLSREEIEYVEKSDNLPDSPFQLILTDFFQKVHMYF